MVASDIRSTSFGVHRARKSILPELTRELDEPIPVTSCEAAEAMAIDDSVGVVVQRERRNSTRPTFQEDVWHPLELRRADDGNGARHALKQLGATTRREQLQVREGVLCFFDGAPEISSPARKGRCRRDHPELRLRKGPRQL